MNAAGFPRSSKWFEKGQVNPEPLISAVYPFEKIDTAFREILEDPEKYLESSAIDGKDAKGRRKQMIP